MANKPTLSRTKTIIISVFVTLFGVALVVVVATATTKAVRHRRRHKDEGSTIQPLDLDEPETNVVSGDLFSSSSSRDDPNVDAVQEYQTECLLTADACTAFSDECCPGLICVPVNQTTSVCSHYKGSICINTGMICNDAVHGVECCDDGICTADGTGRSRCVLPNTATATESRTHKSELETLTPSPTPKPSLRPVH